jgi:acetylornithine/succinyldiaminopimelate/putrescine aminotransferase
MSLIKYHEIKNLDLKTIEKIYIENINPGQVYYYKLLNYHKTLIKKAKGVHLYNQNNEKILDFAGGVGSIGLGHNHPRIIEIRGKFQKEQKHDIGPYFYSQYVAVLSKNLATICPGDLNVVILANVGSEAVEQAIKMVEKYQGPEKSKLIYTKNSFHGRTKGALSITDSKALRNSFRLVEGDLIVDFGNAKQIEQLLSQNKEIGGVVLESIQGGAGVIIPKDGYLKDVRKICDDYGVLLIIDEIQCGFGRTGRLFAFEHDDIIPDIVTLSKSLGGSKASVAATIIRSPIYRQAYKSKKEWYVQMPSTFGGMGEAAVTANEAINILYEEGLIENAEKMGNYFLSKLMVLRDSYPELIKDVRGKGLMIGVEFNDISQTFKPPISTFLSSLDKRLKGSITGFVGSVMLNEFRILVGFTEYNRNVMRLHPPLITKAENIDYFIESFEKILIKGLKGIIYSFIRTKL